MGRCSSERLQEPLSQFTFPKNNLNLKLITLEKTMKTLIATSAIAAILSLGAVGAQAQGDTDRAIGAGGYVHPTGPAQGVWVDGKRTPASPYRIQ